MRREETYLEHYGFQLNCLNVETSGSGKIIICRFRKDFLKQHGSASGNYKIHCGSGL